jgi:hypothetical protein
MRKIIAIAAFALAAVACGDEYQPTERLFAGSQPGEDVFNCTQICDNYQDCNNDDFDRSQCVSSCEDRADYDDAYQAAADRCEACLDSGSCAEQADACADDCDRVING